MSDTLMLCSNCGKYHCCNFRPVSSSTTIKDTVSTGATLMSPQYSRATALNQYQVSGRIPQAEHAGLSPRVFTPKRVQTMRPKSNSTQIEINRRHYLFKKQPQNVPKGIVRQQPILKRRASPMRVNISKEMIQGSLLKTVTRSPMRSRISRVDNSPPRVSQIRSNSPLKKVVQFSPRASSPSQRNAYPISKSPIVIKPSQVLTTPILPIVLAQARKNTTIFPSPGNVMIAQTISKLQNSRTTADDYKQSKVSFPSDHHHQCTYRDNRCFGFDFFGDKKHQLMLDNSGHIKDHLHI